MSSVSSSGVQHNPEGFSLEELLLYSNSGGEPIDLTKMNAFLELTIYTSIMDTKVYGEVVIRDTLNLSHALPIIGNERIELTYKTQGDSFKPVKIQGFITAPLGKARADGEKTEVYKLEFITDTNFMDRFLVVDYSLNGKISDIASTVFSKYFPTAEKPLQINVPTVDEKRYIIPKWSPIYTLTWLAARAYNKNRYSMYSFYEDVDGFHFNDILEETTKSSRTVYRVESNKASNMMDVQRYMSRVMSYSISSYFDRLEEYHMGMYGGVLDTHDITTKKFSETEFDYMNYFTDPGRRTLNMHPLIADNKASELYRKVGVHTNRIVVPMQTKRTNKIDDIEKFERYVCSNRSIMRQLLTHRISITVPGDSSLRLLDTVDFEIQKIGYLMDSMESLDPYLSGKYIIVSLTHRLNRITGYTTEIEIAKDSLVEPIPATIEKTIKK